MTFNSIGDLARGMILRHQSGILKQQMMRLNTELASGVASDLPAHFQGNLTRISDTTHRMTQLDSFGRAAEHARMDAGVMQTALERLQDELRPLAETAISFGNPSGAVPPGALTHEARTTFKRMLTTLNTNMAGRALFAGDLVSSPAVARFTTVWPAIEAAVAGTTTAADISTALDTFFDTPGGGFDTLIYQGGSAPRAAYPLGEGEAITLDLRADDLVFRGALKQTATLALLDSGGTTLSAADRHQLALDAGTALIGHQDQLAGFRSDLGFTEARIDRASSRIAQETNGLQMLHAELLGVDPFKAASELEAVQHRLETIYTLTSRMSRLNLVNFLS